MGLRISNGLKERKGVFFTSLALVLVTLLITSYTIHFHAENRKAVQKRIETMNSFLKSVEEDIPRQLFISGFRALFTMENKLIQTGSYITNVNHSFNEMFFNGTYNNQPEDIMLGATFSSNLEDLSTLSEKMNIDFSITNPQATMDQVDPWNVRVVLTANLTARDRGELASWSRLIESEEFINIGYFDDPLYIINTGGLIIKKINTTNHSSFNSSILLPHTINQNYKASTSAPSFIKRMEGSLSSDPNGIESLVYIPLLDTNNLPVYQKSIVDYIYFSPSSPSYCHVLNMPSWFYLDNQSIGQYNATCG